MKKLAYSWITKILAVALVFAGIGVHSQMVMAASLTSMSDVMSRQKISENANHEIKFVSPTGIQTGGADTIILTFSSEFTLAAEAAVNFDFAVGNSGNCLSATFSEETLALTPSATEWGVDVTGDVITLSPETDDVHAGGLCYRLRAGTNATTGGTGAANTITNPADADDDDSIVFTGAFGDTGTIAVDIITDDQVVVTATVGPSITFVISDNTIGFSSLTTVASRYATGDGTGSASEVAAHTLAASTNATSGYVITVFGPTLTSGANTITAIGGTNTAPATNTEQFGVRYEETGAGTGTVTAPYAAAGFAYDGITTPDEIASATGATDTSTYSARYLANIDINTQAGAYETTLTYTATGTF